MSVSLETLERIKGQLKEARDQGNNVKLDLYTHLTEVFNRIMLHNQHDAYHKFEEISHLIKQTHLKITDPKFDHEINEIESEQRNPQLAQWL
jgi:transcriptional regulatory protein LevR